MATTWLTIQSQLDWLLEEPVASGKLEWPLASRVDAWNMAQRSFTAHTSRESSVSLPVQASLCQLPTDFFVLATLFSGQDELKTGRGLDYRLWDGRLCFSGSGIPSQVEMTYYAYWPSVLYELDASGVASVTAGEIHVPAWAELPLIHFTISILMVPKAVQSAMNREYNIKIDSGGPDDNARRTQAREHLWWYRELLKEHPVQARKGK